MGRAARAQGRPPVGAVADPPARQPQRCLRALRPRMGWGARAAPRCNHASRLEGAGERSEGGCDPPPFHVPGRVGVSVAFRGVCRGARRSRVPRNTPAPIDRRRTRCRERRRRHPVQRAVRAVVMVIPSPPLRHVLRLLQTQEPFEVQEFIPQIPVERLDVRISFSAFRYRICRAGSDLPRRASIRMSG